MKVEAQQHAREVERIAISGSCIQIKILTINEYKNICAQKNLPILAAVIHTNKVKIKTQWPTVYSSLPAFTEHCIELYLTTTMPCYQQVGAIQLAFTNEFLFGLIIGRSDHLEQTSYRLYTKLIKQTRKYGKPFIYRMWNEIPFINHEENGIERYKQFCKGRAQAFEENFWSTTALPAASAVGSTSEQLNIYFLSGQRISQAQENSLQVSAYQYPPQYGSKSPCFVRAQRLEMKNGSQLFISGTASILGHKSMHLASVLKQTQQTFSNIRFLVKSIQHKYAMEYPQHKNFYSLKVYIRNKQDFSFIKNTLERLTQNTATIIYVQADICRHELLVEIEAQFKSFKIEY